MSNEQRKKISFQKKYLIIGCIVLVLIGLGLVGYFVFRPIKQPEPQIQMQWKEFQNETQKIKFSYPESFKTIKLTDEDTKANVLIKLEQIEPQALIALRYEESLGMLKATGGSILDELVENINRQYPERYFDYKKEKFEEIIVANEQTAQFYFTYLGKDEKTRIKQRFVVIVKDTTGFYVSIQSPETEFDKSATDFEKIIQSISFL